MIPAAQALARLREGNRRFVAEVEREAEFGGQEHRTALVAGQEPFAVILGCSDSRVPAEIVFGQGLGDLFVVRVAGNVAAPSQVASVEFAAQRLGVRLVVVLGHSNCGAVQATLEGLEHAEEETDRNLASIVDRIRPSVEPLLTMDHLQNREEVVAEAVRANIRASANHLRHGSKVLARLAETENLIVVGAEYSLETGLVDFFHGSASVTR